MVSKSYCGVCAVQYPLGIENLHSSKPFKFCYYAWIILTWLIQIVANQIDCHSHLLVPDFDTLLCQRRMIFVDSGEYGPVGFYQRIGTRRLTRGT